MTIHTQDNIIDRDELQANYINTILDGMDIKDMMRILYDQFDENLDKYTVDELIGEVKEYYPELLDWLTQTRRPPVDDRTSGTGWPPKRPTLCL